MTMRELLTRCRNTLRNTPDTVCLERARLMTEAYRRHDGEPVVLKRAHALAHVLNSMTLDMETNPVFAGNTSSRPRAWMLLAEYDFHVPGQALVEKPSLEGLLDGDAVPPDLREFWEPRQAGRTGIGHLCPDYSLVLERGLESLAVEAERLAEAAEEEEANFRRACAAGLRAVIHWAERYADAADAAAHRADDPLLAECHSRVAAACRRVPARPPRNFFEACQAIVLVHLAIHIEGHAYSVSLGRLDRWLAPFYRREPEARDLLAALLLKLTANSVFGSHSKTQAVTVGGVTADGADASNELTMRILEAFEIARMPDPHVFLCWGAELRAEVKDKALCMLADHMSMPLLVDDERAAAGLAAAGCTLQDAWNYCIVGCNEIGIPGKLIWNSVGSVNAAGALRETVLRSAGSPPADMDGLVERARESLRTIAAERVQAKLDKHRRHAEVVPTPFTSALMDGCVRRGRDMHARLTYDHLSYCERGFANAVNGLAAIEKLVYRDGTTTLPDLAAAMENDFKGHEELLERIAECPKWGNDDPAADVWAHRWLAMRDQVLEDVAHECGLPPLLACHVARSLHHIDGFLIGATPDGRRAGEPVADSIGAVLGTAMEGPTAVLNSVSRLETDRHWRGGYNLNITLPAVRTDDGEMLAKVQAMTDVFFATGGQELQLAFLSPEVLEEARAHPEKHPDLMVRIAGFNARFVELGGREQDEIIARARQAQS